MRERPGALGPQGRAEGPAVPGGAAGVARPGGPFEQRRGVLPAQPQPQAEQDAIKEPFKGGQGKPKKGHRKGPSPHGFKRKFQKTGDIYKEGDDEAPKKVQRQTDVEGGPFGNPKRKHTGNRPRKKK